MLKENTERAVLETHPFTETAQHRQRGERERETFSLPHIIVHARAENVAFFPPGEFSEAVASLGGDPAPPDAADPAAPGLAAGAGVLLGPAATNDGSSSSRSAGSSGSPFGSSSAKSTISSSSNSAMVVVPVPVAKS